MTEEFLKAINNAMCKFCNGEGVLHSRMLLPRWAGEPIFYEETHYQCKECDGFGYHEALFVGRE